VHSLERGKEHHLISGITKPYIRAIAVALADPIVLERRVSTAARRNVTTKILAKLLVTVVACSVAASVVVQAGAHDHDSQPSTDPDWLELIASMDKMHTAMGAIERSGDSDVDFVRLMLPHHQAALDMARTQLLYGKDPQMRRLAQEIITDQQLEIELMQRWLKQQQPNQAKENQTAAVNTGKDN